MAHPFPQRDRRALAAAANALLCGALLVLSLGVAAHGDPVRIGVLAKRGDAYTLARWGPTADYLSGRIGGRSFVIVPLDFTAIYAAAADGEVEFILSNSAIYVDLEMDYQAERVATLANRVDGRAYHHFGGVILAPADRGDLQGLADLRGQRLAAVAANSLGGYLTQARELRGAGVHLPRDAAALAFLGTHDAVVQAVLRGEADAGLVRTDTLETMAAEGLVDPARLRVVAPREHPGFPLACSTRLYPEWPLARLPHTPESLTRELVVALLRMGPDHPAAVAGHYGGWAPPGNYREVHDLLEELQAGPYERQQVRTIVRTLRRHWPWLAAGGAAVLALVAVTAVIARLNRDLRRSRRALEGARDQLEARVRERTRELEQTLARLRQSEQRYRLLLDGANDAVFVHALAPDGQPTRFTEVNQEACRRLGYSREELLRMGPADMNTSDSARDIPARAAALVRDHHGVFESVHLTRDGTPIPVEVSAHLFDLDGTPTVLSLARDIRERKAAEAALRRSRRGLAEAQRIAHLGNWEWDITDGGLEWSEEIYHIFGHQPVGAPITYQDFLGYLHPDDRPLVEAAVAAALEGTPYALDHRVVRRDGAERLVHERGEVTRDADGRPQRMIGTVQDVTEARRREGELRRLNRALSTISLCNQALVRAETEQGLLEEICQVLVDSGGYPLAWVGYGEKGPNKPVRVVARACQRPGYLDGLDIRWDADAPEGQGPVGRCIREGRPVIADDLAGDPAFAPWRERTAQWGFTAAAALPVRVEGETIGALSLYASRANPFDPAELELLDEMAEDLAFGIRALRARDGLRRSENRLRASLEQTVEAMSVTIETRDPYTAGHQRRVNELALAIARRLDLAPATLEGLHFSALIHDIGKLYVPAEFLNRPGRLAPAEFEIIRSHARVGYDIIRQVDFPWPVAEIIHQHHERLDGSGYPRGLAGDEILLEARILAVADVFEAMTAHRPYRPALPVDTAVAELRDHRASRYDPAVVDACLELLAAGAIRPGPHPAVA